MVVAEDWVNGLIEVAPHCHRNTFTAAPGANPL